MRTENNSIVNYFLHIGNHEIFLNDLLGRSFELKYLNEINCIKCGRKTSKSFAQGYCFPCFQTAPETEECVLRPELCRAHEGVARDIEYANAHCLIDHIVYLSFTSEIKVGVTRHTQVPTRWIDQGAIAAVEIACTPNRYIAGLIEVALKSYYPDKTNWRKMLIALSAPLDLLLEKKNAQNNLPNELRKYSSKNTPVFQILYPGKIPEKSIKSFDLDKNKNISDILIGIKGQYLVFKTGYVINIRKYAGYLVEINY